MNRAILTVIAVFIISTIAYADVDLGKLSKSDHPEKQKYELTNYLKGTPDQILDLLNRGPLEWDAKISDSRLELQKIRQRYKDNEDGLYLKLHSKPEYKQEAETAQKSAKELEKAQKSGSDISLRMVLSERMNSARTKMKAWDDEVKKDKYLQELIAEEKRIADRLANQKEQLQKTLKWREELISAVLNSYTLRGPVLEGDSFGIPNTVTVIEVSSKGNVMVDFTLWEPREALEEHEGITTTNYRGQKVKMMIKGLDDVYRFKIGDEICISQNVKLVRDIDLGQGRCLVTETDPRDFDLLLRKITKPLPLVSAPATSQPSH